MVSIYAFHALNLTWCATHSFIHFGFYGFHVLSLEPPMRTCAWSIESMSIFSEIHLKIEKSSFDNKLFRESAVSIEVKASLKSTLVNFSFSTEFNSRIHWLDFNFHHVFPKWLLYLNSTFEIEIKSHQNCCNWHYDFVSLIDLRTVRLIECCIATNI